MKTIIPFLDNPEECMAFAQAINPKREPLTVEKLRTFPGCEHYNDEGAARIIETIRQLAYILFKCASQAEDVSTTPAPVVPIKEKASIKRLHPVKSKAS